MRIGYFADGQWSHLALEKILSDNRFDIAFIVARFDNPDPFLRVKASNLGIPFYVEENINSDSFLKQVIKMECDIYVSMSFNQIFKEDIMSCTKHGIINCHAGKLPFYRGRNVLNWVLINDEDHFGVTVHYVDSGIDTGDIIVQETFSITDHDDYATLLSRAYKHCADLLFSALILLADGKAKRVVQRDIHPVGFYCSERKIGDEVLNWNQPSRDIFNFVRAVSAPGPKARTFLGTNEVSINKVELVDHAPDYRGVPGAVVGIEPDVFYVKTATSMIKVVEWSCDRKIKIGDRLS